jgi:hypothetical protein
MTHSHEKALGPLAWRGIAWEIERALRSDDVDAMKAALSRVRETRHVFELADHGRSAVGLASAFEAVRRDFFGMAAPLCTRMSKATRDIIKSRWVHQAGDEAALDPRIRDQFDQEAIDGTQRRIATLWLTVLPRITAESAAIAWNEIGQRASGSQLLDEAQTSLELLNRVERTRIGSQQMNDELLVEVHRQLQSGLSFQRKLIEAAPLVYASSGVHVTTRQLARLVQRSEFPLSIALERGDRAEAIGRVLAGCIPECYPRDGEPPSPDGPHVEALSFRRYSVSTFKAAHAAEGWLDARLLGVVGAREEIRPLSDPADRPDPALWTTDKWDVPIRELLPGPAQGCAAIFDGGFQAAKQAAVTLAATREIWGRAIAEGQGR